MKTEAFETKQNRNGFLTSRIAEFFYRRYSQKGLIDYEDLAHKYPVKKEINISFV